MNTFISATDLSKAVGFESFASVQKALKATGWFYDIGTDAWRKIAPEELSYRVKNSSFPDDLTSACQLVHKCNAKWWHSLETGARIERNVPEMLMLIVSEIAEAMEGHRKSLQDDKLPHRPMLEVELADALIRIMDLSAGLGLDLAGAWKEKMLFNLTREDHSVEARKAPGGKIY